MLFELAISLATTFLSPVQSKPQTAKTQVIYVKESKEPCTGVAPMECLQVKGVNDKEWSNLYTDIKGFKYTPGYRYKLRVRVTTIKNPPADGSSMKYTLARVLEKKKISNSSNFAAIEGKKWVLTKMDGAAIPGGRIWIAFDAAQKRVHGKSGCNAMTGGYTISGSNITFSRPAGTLMACAEDVMKQEGAFLEHIGDKTLKYSVSGNTVSLSDKGKTVMQFELQENSDEANANTIDQKLWAFIASKKWNVIKLNDETLTNGGIWVEFDTDKQRFHGKGGCNSISGSYSTAKEDIKFGPAISTRMACVDADVMRRENTFLKLLSENTYRYDVADQTLNLYKDGKIVVMFGMQNKQ
ncbi:META domain-containing protein [Chitinophaga sp. 212800010-3]|uniref:META domain-containing protein n=1 Tax=unclassified Chitinophaga TaxID=2619133 RepID=UPI002DEA60EB|nr:Heat shock protein HslJ [Chitinophaga sp. 212800010-3]